MPMNLPLPPMTATQKLLAHAVGLASVQAGDVISLPIDWAIASELALKGMLVTNRQLGEPALAREDRFFLAVDHTVSPFRDPGDYTVNAKGLIALAEGFRRRYPGIRFAGANETILHTFPFERLFRPGDVVVGADSHSIYHGGLGAFSIGLGAADVMAAMVMGKFLLRVPEAIRIDIEGELPTMLTGKDLILAILQRFKRNTIAMERTVEYGGEGLRHLSVSARGTLCNMGAEFGAMTSFVIPDEVVARFLATRRGEFNQGGVYFRPDEAAAYVAREVMTLGLDMAPRVAVHPSPDNVYAVNDEPVAGKVFDIAFVGSCTATPEEFVLAALTADAALRAGWTPVDSGNPMARMFSPSSANIAAMLQTHGLIDPLERAGFKVGRSGCSFCLGVDGSAAPAGAWLLGTHNRTFENRTGKGSFSMASNAAVVMASSFGMRVRDPRELLPHFDQERYDRIMAELRGRDLAVEFNYAEPVSVADRQVSATSAVPGATGPVVSTICSKVVRFGDNVDTDAIIAGRFCHIEDVRELGRHAFENDRGEGVFAQKVEAEGHGIVAAGEGWGSGSSREEAVYALIGAGVKLVLAKSLAFIHRRNLVNQNLPFRLIHPQDHLLYDELVQEGSELQVDLVKNQLYVTGQPERVVRLLPLFPEEVAIQGMGGLAEAYRAHGVGTLGAIQDEARQIEAFLG